MLMCGGLDASNQILSDCWLLDLREMRWEVVETSAPQLPTLRSQCSFLSGSPALKPASSEHSQAPELGRCSISWSSADDVAIVWGGSGRFWAWREPEVQRWKREERCRRLSQASHHEGFSAHKSWARQPKPCETLAPYESEVDEGQDKQRQANEKHVSQHRSRQFDQGSSLHSNLASTHSKERRLPNVKVEDAIATTLTKALPDVLAPARMRRTAQTLSTGAAQIPSHCDLRHIPGFTNTWAEFGSLGELRTKAVAGHRGARKGCKEAAAPVMIMESVDEWPPDPAHMSLSKAQSEVSLTRKAPQRFRASASQVDLDWPLNSSQMPIAKVRREAPLLRKSPSTPQRDINAASRIDLATMSPVCLGSSRGLYGPGSALSSAALLRPLSHFISASAVCVGDGCWGSSRELI